MTKIKFLKDMLFKKYIIPFSGKMCFTKQGCKTGREESWIRKGGESAQEKRERNPQGDDTVTFQEELTTSPTDLTLGRTP